MVITHGMCFDNWFIFGTLNHTASVLDASDGELGFKPASSQFHVNEWM